MSDLIGKEGGGSEVETFGCYVGVLSGCQWHGDPAEPVWRSTNTVISFDK